MDYFPWILVAVAVLGYIWYASLIGKRNKALIPNILTIAKKFMTHEKSLLEEITALRSQADQDYDKKDGASVKEHIAAVEQLGGKMSQLMVQVEAYPDLKSDTSMLQAQQTYNNSAVTALNNSIQIFPGNIIANIANVTEMPFYEVDEASKAPVNAADFL